MAPFADLVNIRAFDANGQATYAHVIEALQWILDYRDAYGIRVANLSFSATPVSYYWDDPLNQAVMRLWQNGIVVVASAGNNGPDAMTIGVPGNVPYVITVGAMSNRYTLDVETDDILASSHRPGPRSRASSSQTSSRPAVTSPHTCTNEISFRRPIPTSSTKGSSS